MKFLSLVLLFVVYSLADVCRTKNTSPLIPASPDAYHVPYLKDYVLLKGTNFTTIVLDHKTDLISYICCKPNEITFFWKGQPMKEFLYDLSSSKTIYITGGPEWGCNGNKPFYSVFEKTLDNDSGLTRIQVHEGKREDIFRKEFSTELCFNFRTEILDFYHEVEKYNAEAKGILKTIEDVKEHIDKIGSSTEKQSTKVKYVDASNHSRGINEYFKEISKIYLNACSESDVSDARGRRNKAYNMLQRLKKIGSDLNEFDKNIQITNVNVFDLIKGDYKEIHKIASGFDSIKASLTFKWSYNKEVANAYLKNITSLVNSVNKDYQIARTCEVKCTNAQAKQIYNNFKNNLKKAQDYHSTYKKTCEVNKIVNESFEEELETAEGLLDNARKKVKNYNPDIKDPGSVKNRTPQLVQKYISFQNRYDEAKKFKAMNPSLITDLENFITKTIPLGVQECIEFESVYANVTSVIKDAKSAKNQLEKRDKDKAKIADKKIDEASTKQKDAKKVYDNAQVPNAVNTIKAALLLAKEAYKLSIVTVDSSSFTSATTTKSNFVQRRNILYVETSDIVKETNIILKRIKEFDKDKYKLLDNELGSAFSMSTKCMKEGSFKAIDCLQKQKNQIKSLKTTIEGELKNVLSRFEIKIVNNVVSIPDSKVKKVHCSGNDVSITFSEKVFIDLRNGLIIKGNSGCYDVNTNQKGAYTKVVSSINDNSPKKISFISSADTLATLASNVVGLNFTESPSGSYVKGSFIGATLKVKDQNLQNKEATIYVISGTSQKPFNEFSTTVALKNITEIRIKITSDTSLNSALLQVKVGNNVVATSSTQFSINPTIRFTEPVKDTQYFIKDVVSVKFDVKKKLFSKAEYALSFINLATNKSVFTKKLFFARFKENVKDLDAKIVTGKYKLALNVNGVVVYSNFILDINRSPDAFAKLEFISPKAGESYKKGQVLTIRWNPINMKPKEKISFYLQTEDKFFNSLFPVKSKVFADQKYIGFEIDTDYSSSKFYIKAKWSDGQEMNSDLFTINKDNCFKFGKISALQKADGSYDVSVPFEKLKTCSLRASDNFRVTLVTIVNNKETKDPRYHTLTADRQSYNETFTLNSGVFSKLRFLITTDKDSKGEVSDDFVCPLEGLIDFSIPDSLSIGFDCNYCLVDFSTDEKGAFYVGFQEQFCTLCKPIIAAKNKLLQTFKKTLTSFFSNKEDVQDSTGAVSKLKEEAEKEPTFVDSFLEGFEVPYIGIYCSSCQVVGSYKMYDLEKYGLNIKSGVIDAIIEYDFNFEVTLEVAWQPYYETVDIEHALNHEKIKTAFSQKQLNKLLEVFNMKDKVESICNLANVEIPVYGYAFSRSNVEAELAIILALSLRITGRIVVGVSATGKFSLHAVVVSDSNHYLKKTDLVKPTYDFELLQAEIEFKLDIAIRAQLDITIKGVFEFIVYVTAAQVSGTATYSFTGFEPKLDQSPHCEKEHSVELSAAFKSINLYIEVNAFKILSSIYESPYVVELPSPTFCPV